MLFRSVLTVLIQTLVYLLPLRRGADSMWRAMAISGFAVLMLSNLAAMIYFVVLIVRKRETTVLTLDPVNTSPGQVSASASAAASPSAS